MTRGELAAAIYRASHITGQFRLRSGATSTEYFDKYRFESEPRLLHSIAEGMAGLVPPNTEILAGLELGGIPLATMVSQLTGLPALFVRKAAKEYGTCRLAEGGDVAGRRLLLVEDVVTSGGALLDATRELRALGGQVADAICVIDRESGGPGILAAQGIALRSLFSMSELKAAVQADGPTPGTASCGQEAAAVHFRGMAPRLPVAKLPRTIDFYTRMLGFTVDILWPDGAPTFTMLARGGAMVGFFEPTAHQPGPVGYAELYVEVSDAQALHRALAGRVPIEWGPEVYSYGRREFALRDPDGHLVIFTEPTGDAATTAEPA